MKALEELNPFPKRMGKPDEYGGAGRAHLHQHHAQRRGHPHRRRGAVPAEVASARFVRSRRAQRHAQLTQLVSRAPPPAGEVGELARVGAVHGVAGVAGTTRASASRSVGQPVARLVVPRRGVDAATDQAGHADVGEVERRAPRRTRSRAPSRRRRRRAARACGAGLAHAPPLEHGPELGRSAHHLVVVGPPVGERHRRLEDRERGDEVGPQYRGHEPDDAAVAVTDDGRAPPVERVDRVLPRGRPATSAADPRVSDPSPGGRR